MNDEQRLAAFAEGTRLHITDGAALGLHPIHMANILMLAAIEIAVEAEGIERTRIGLRIAADNLGTGDVH